MKKKLYGLLVVSMMLLSGTIISANQETTRIVNEDLGITESTVDNSILSKTVDVKKSSFIGQDDNIDMSPTYIQTTEYGGKNYLRFATAVKGSFSDIYWTRTVDGNTVNLPVEKVYKGLSSNGQTLYYTGEGVSSNASYSDMYYWAVYTARFDTDNKKPSDFSLNLNVVNREEQVSKSFKRTTSLQYELDFAQLQTNVTNEWAGSITDRESDFVEKGSLTNGTLFMGDSFFDTDSFWTDFYTNHYSGKNARSANISATTITDWDVFASRFVYPAAPKNLVIHCGTNDLYDDLHSKEVVLKDTQRLLEKLHTNLPQTKIYYFGIEPRTYGINGENISNTIATLNSFNSSMKSYCDGFDFVTYVDSPALCYNADGSVKAEFFRDGIHPQLANYGEYVRLLSEVGMIVDNNESTAIGNFSTYADQSIGATSRLFYSKGVQLSNNFVLSGKLSITDTGVNAHIQFDLDSSLGQDGDRFLLWDNNNDNVFGAGYACNNGYTADVATPSRSLYSKVNNQLNLDWKVIITQKNAYLYLNNVLELVMINIPQNKYFQIGTENARVDFFDMSVVAKMHDEAQFNAIVGDDRIQRYEQLASVDSSRRVIRDYYLDTEFAKDKLNGPWSFDHEYDADSYVEMAGEAGSVGFIKNLHFKNVYSTRWYAQMTIQTVVPAGELTDKFPKMGLGSYSLDGTNTINNLVWYAQDYANGTRALTTGEYTMKNSEWNYDTINSYEWFDTKETVNNISSTMTYGLLRDNQTYYYFRENNLINVITEPNGVLANTPSYAGLVGVGGMGAKVSNYFAKTGAEVDNLLNSLARNVAVSGTDWTKNGQVSVLDNSTFKFGIDEKSSGVKPWVNSLTYNKPLNGAFEIEYDVSNFYGDVPSWYWPKLAVIVNGHWMCYAYRDAANNEENYARFETCCYNNWQNSPDFGFASFDPLATHHVKITCTASGQIAMYLDGQQIVLEGSDIYNRNIGYNGSNGSLTIMSEFAGFEVSNFTVRDNL